HRHRGEILSIGGGGTDLELAALGRARRVVPLPVDPKAAAVLALAGPGDDEVAGRVHGYRGDELDIGRGGIDAELAALGHPRRVVPLPVYATAAAVLALAGPGHHEVAGRVHRHRGEILSIGGGGTDAELAALGHSRRVVPLPVYPKAATVLVLAGP